MSIGDNYEVVIFAGGLGTRLKEETEFRPKALLEIDGIPIIVHVMEIYALQGCKHFIICAGHLGTAIHNYFENSDFNVSSNIIEKDENSTLYLFHCSISGIKVKVRVVNTGETTLAGGRLFKIRNYLIGENFACTYSDGVGNINLSALKLRHQNESLSCTVTAVKPPSRFGILEINELNHIESFMEKPNSFWVNGGFFIFNKKVFDYMDEETNLELSLLPFLAAEGELNAYLHNGFWHPMDTQRDFEKLNELARESNQSPPWLIEFVENLSL